MSRDHWLAGADTDLFLTLNGAHAEWLDGPMVWISEMAFWFPLYAFFLYLLQRRFGWRGLAWAVPVLAAMIFASDTGSVVLFKNTVQRLRPCWEPALEGLVHVVDGCGGQYGFVSSHAARTTSEEDREPGVHGACFCTMRRKMAKKINPIVKPYSPPTSTSPG